MSVITRADPPCNQVAVALSLNLLGAKSLNACTRAGNSVDSFPRWYTRRLNTLLHLDVGPEAFSLFRGGMDRAFALACQTSTLLNVPDRAHGEYRTTRPISLIHRDLHSRRYGLLAGETTKRKPKSSSGTSKLPKISRTIRIGTTSSSQSSVVTVVPALRHVRNTPEWSFTLPNHNWLIKFFVRLTGGRTFTVPTVGSHDSNEGTILTTLPSFDPEQHEGQCTQHDTESLFPREGSPSKLGGRKEFDVNIKNAAWELASEFSSTSSLLLGMYKAQVPKDKIALLVIEALSLRAKSTATMEGIVKHVSGLVLFYLDTREESKVQLAGGDSLVLIHDYLESLAERGRTVHAAAKHALTVWAEALGIDWPLTHALVCSAATVESNDSPKQAPPMSLSTLRALGETATNILATPYKRAFDAGILLMTYASLRFSDVQRIRTFEFNEDSAHGALLNCKTRKQHGQFWPMAFRREGITGSRVRAQPLIDMRIAFRRINGNGPTFTSMRIDRA